jgi:glucokinase
MKKLLCGVDLGGTKLSTALISQDGQILHKTVDCSHVNLSENQLVDQLAGNIKNLLQSAGVQESELLGIGIGCAGHVRFNEGVLITTSNLKGFKNYPLRDAVQAHFKVPVILDNDANAQAFGEFKFGGFGDYDSLIFLTLSTGIGAGIIFNHRLYRGFTGTAGEFGHTIVNAHSDLVCTCGNRGCLMGEASGLALPHIYCQKKDAGFQSILDLPAHFDYSKINGTFIKTGFDKGDPICREVILESAFYVGIGIYNIFQALNPKLIVLGGGLTSWGDFYLDEIKRVFHLYARDMIFDPVDIELTRLGSDAGLLGSASLVLELC